MGTAPESGRTSPPSKQCQNYFFAGELAADGLAFAAAGEAAVEAAGFAASGDAGRMPPRVDGLASIFAAN